MPLGAAPGLLCCTSLEHTNLIRSFELDADLPVLPDPLGGPSAGQGELLLAVGVESCHAVLGQTAGGKTPQEARVTLMA